MKTSKGIRLYRSVFAALLFCFCMSVTAGAAVVKLGTCGTRFDDGNVVYRLDENGLLTISLDDGEDLDTNRGTVESAPWDHKLVTEVVLQRGVTRIAKDVFRYHENLKKVTLPEGFEWIGGGVFYNCVNLSEITAPEGFVLVEYGLDDEYHVGVFEECCSLRSVPILGERIYSRTFFHCSSLNHVVIAEGVTDIGEYAFSECTSLSDLTIPGTVKYIGNQAFNGCGLKTFTIPDGVEEIPMYTFAYNKKLKSISIPDSVTRIGESAFAECALKEVKLSKKVSYIGGNDYGDGTITFAFDKNVIIDAPAGSYAADWAKLNGFVLKGSKKTDGTAKKKVKTKAGTFTISGKQATFTAPADKKATSLSVPSKVKGIKVTAIAPNACAKMTKLKKVTIPSGVKTIGKKAFYGCKKLKKIIIKTKKLTGSSIGSKAFGSVYKKAVVQCPKGKKSSYKKILLKKGLKKTAKFK